MSTNPAGTGEGFKVGDLHVGDTLSHFTSGSWGKFKGMFPPRAEGFESWTGLKIGKSELLVTEMGFARWWRVLRGGVEIKPFNPELEPLPSQKEDSK